MKFNTWQIKKQLPMWRVVLTKERTYLDADSTEKGLMIIFSLYPLTKGTQNWLAESRTVS